METTEKKETDRLREVCGERLKKSEEWTAQGEICDLLFNKLIGVLGNDEKNLFVKYLEELDDLHEIEIKYIACYALSSK